MKGGNPVSDLLTKELSGVIEPNLILQTYLNLQSFFQNSVRPFDQTIKNIFEAELQKRGIPFIKDSHNQNEIYNDNEKQKYNDNDNHIRREESLTDSVDESIITTNAMNKGIIYYENYFGTATDSVVKEINFWSKELSEERVVTALSLSKKAKHPMNYAIKILDNWKNKN